MRPCPAAYTRLCCPAITLPPSSLLLLQRFKCESPSQPPSPSCHPPLAARGESSDCWPYDAFVVLSLQWHPSTIVPATTTSTTTTSTTTTTTTATTSTLTSLLMHFYVSTTTNAGRALFHSVHPQKQTNPSDPSSGNCRKSVRVRVHHRVVIVVSLSTPRQCCQQAASNFSKFCVRLCSGACRQHAVPLLAPLPPHNHMKGTSLCTHVAACLCVKSYGLTHAALSRGFKPEHTDLMTSLLRLLHPHDICQTCGLLLLTQH